MAVVPAPAAVRTIAPIVVGAVLSFLTTRGIEVSSETRDYLTLGTAGVLGSTYYVALLALESRWPRLGILLGSTARPIYEGKHRKASSDPTAATSDSPDEKL
ncbi:hypothetical protein E6R60_26910 [Streptomyces sp. A0642]|uniref:hypothetical protein n=1 Tax=Streptomyces sp. A0642 TaxID=2563100 RepID=UPI0010A28C1F|nr:hypothetical protein [Streptomyces sp. A0642]THA72562.1 hypothetical protein E6R60_26910 [Streptomyces sp. A0642]